jgi:hypothetical protein
LNAPDPDRFKNVRIFRSHDMLPFAFLIIITHHFYCLQLACLKYTANTKNVDYSYVNKPQQTQGRPLRRFAEHLHAYRRGKPCVCPAYVLIILTPTSPSRHKIGHYEELAV